ncbi:MAG TPA: SDR family oxidoreductase [Terracidiphilus sp.]|nr:SDR family oxidoreductase [Terracidiphilus sp.]
MRIFITGATGFVGSAIVPELIGASHQVLGLARSDAAAASLAAMGADVQRGSLENLESLRNGASAADAVIHAGFIHDFANYAAAAETDRRAIETIGAALAGSDRLFIVTSGTALAAPGRMATEEDAASSNFPRKSEEVAASAAAKGARVTVLRLPPSVHGVGDHGFIPILINLAREKGVSAYVGEGLNRWPAVHRLDAARLYRLALEKSPIAPRYHAVADEGVPFREIARVIGRRLNLPVVSKSAEEAADHFGWFAHFAGLDCPASSARTQQQLGWRPTQPSLIPDIDQPAYFEAIQKTFDQRSENK